MPVCAEIQGKERVIRMKQKKYRGLMLFMLGGLLLTGCQEAPYELTKEEEALIVSYSTHIVSKYNIYQKNGLTYLTEKEKEEKHTEAVKNSEIETNTEIKETISAGSDGASQAEGEAVTAKLSSVYQDTGLTISYQGSEIIDSYVDGTTYAAEPSSGKAFLVLNLLVENETKEAITFQNFGSGTSYSAKYVSESGKAFQAQSVMTLVSKEFSTYEGTIEAGTSVDMVLLFEIPADVTEVDSIVLKINRNEKVFEINL